MNSDSAVVILDKYKRDLTHIQYLLFAFMFMVFLIICIFLDKGEKKILDLITGSEFIISVLAFITAIGSLLVFIESEIISIKLKKIEYEGKSEDNLKFNKIIASKINKIHIVQKGVCGE